MSDYIRTDLLDDVRLRLFGNEAERGYARDRIITNAIGYAQANTQLSKDRVKKTIGKAVDLLHEFYRRNIKNDLLFITSEITDSVASTVIEQNREQTRVLFEKIDQISGSAVLSIDKSVRSILSGEIRDVERNIGSFMNCINTQHRLYPDYGYSLDDKYTLRSVPLTKDATKKYPPRLNMMVDSIQLGSKNIDIINFDAFEYASRHQLPITFDVLSATKYLGEIIDPLQHEADEIKGAHIIMHPRPFPPAFACSLGIDGFVYFNYLLMRIKTILDDGSILLTNEEQSPRAYDLSCTLAKPAGKMAFTMKQNTTSNIDILVLKKFFKHISDGGRLTMKRLLDNQTLVEGQLSPIKYPMIDKEIALLEKIISIEKHFAINISIPQHITLDEYEAINRLYSLIHKGFYMCEWSLLEITFIITIEFKSRVADMTNDKYKLEYSEARDIELFGQMIHLNVTKRFNCVMMENLEKLKQKVKVLDPGDTIKIRLVPGVEDPTFLETMLTQPPKE